MAILFLSFFIFSCDKGQVIETIGGQDVHDKDYERYYATSVDLASRMSGADETFLSRMVCDEESQLSVALKPSSHYERYRDAVMVARVAEKEGFLKDPKVQAMLEQSRLQTIGQLYVNYKLIQSTTVPEDAKVKVCETLRKKEPEKMAQLSLDDCLKVAEGLLKRRLIAERSDQVLSNIKQNVTIRKNDKFDLTNYLKNLKQYKSLREKGGCVAGEASSKEKDSSDTKSSKSK